MKTKIVYSIVSGYNDDYLEQLWISFLSLKYHNPNAHVVLVTDNKTFKTFTGKRSEMVSDFDEVIHIEVPEDLTNMQSSRFLKTTLRQHVQGDFLFIDSDTIICDSLDNIDDLVCKYQLGAVVDGHVLMDEKFNQKHAIDKKAASIGWILKYPNGRYFNSGVLLVSDSKKNYDFYQKWHSFWQESRKAGLNYDQYSLAKANEYYDYPIQELSGIWNCQIQNFSMPYLGEAKIIHYFRSWFVDSNSYYYWANKKIFEELKKTGTLTDEMNFGICHGRLAFERFSFVGSEKIFTVVKTSSFRLLANFPVLRAFLDSLLDFFLRFK